MSDTLTGRNRLFLAGGIVAGPIYVLAGFIQILTREGFDVTRHPLSLMSLGDLGWIQITNFILTGLLVVAAAIALRSGSRADKRFRRGALLIGIYGVCVIGGGVFLPDPALGFPPGTPDAYPESFSSHGLLHFIFGNVGFLSLIAASFVFARCFASQRMRRWSAYSVLTGVTYIVAIGSTAATAGSAWSTVLLYAAVALGWSWVSAISVYGRQELGKRAPE